MNCRKFDVATGLWLNYGKHEPGQRLLLPTGRGESYAPESVEAFVCARCRLVYVPEEKQHEENPTAERMPG
jgi:hypothetical protein